MKYLRKFDNLADYQSYIGGGKIKLIAQQNGNS